jgi:hypothetical protein
MERKKHVGETRRKYTLTRRVLGEICATKTGLLND